MSLASHRRGLLGLAAGGALAASLPGCSLPRRLPAVASHDVASATVLGIPNERFRVTLGAEPITREIDAAGAELIDRFGPLPSEVEALLKVILIKALCRTANVEKVEAGPRGAVVVLRHNEFPDPAGLVRLMADPAMHARVKPDQKLVFARDWPNAEARLKGTAAILSRLARLAQGAASVTTLAR